MRATVSRLLAVEFNLSDLLIDMIEEIQYEVKIITLIYYLSS
ncbi:unnamed protein product [Arabidopsis lyrata]|nr:unnamed protein product [Arabidopsis lyrata]